MLLKFYWDLRGLWSEALTYRDLISFLLDPRIVGDIDLSFRSSLDISIYLDIRRQWLRMPVTFRGNGWPL